MDKKALGKLLGGKDIGLFGGSFNPPHNGHLEIINDARRRVDELCVVPTFANPLKPNRRFLEGSKRLALLDELTLGFENVHALDYEIRQGVPTYTIDTLRYLEGFAPASITLFMGEDCLKNLPMWKDIDIILSSVKLLVYKRSQTLHLDGAIISLPRLTISDELRGLLASANYEIVPLLNPAASSILQQNIKLWDEHIPRGIIEALKEG